jgi:hypothetical protein
LNILVQHPGRQFKAIEGRRTPYTTPFPVSITIPRFHRRSPFSSSFTVFIVIHRFHRSPSSSPFYPFPPFTRRPLFLLSNCRSLLLFTVSGSHHHHHLHYRTTTAADSVSIITKVPPLTKAVKSRPKPTRNAPSTN